MALTIAVRDYRGIERADIALDPIALVAGVNEQGKSCLAQATRAALAGEALPIPGVNKKDAKLLVRDGADEGYAQVDEGAGVTTTVSWPKATVAVDTAASSEFAVGLKHLFDLDDKERANVLAGYINTKPDVTDLAAAMGDAGYGDKAVDQVWKAITADGWDATYKRSREHTTKMKGQWEDTAGEKYGSKKAANWQPEGHPDAEASRDDLEAAVDQAHARVKEAVGTAAVSEAEIMRLNAEAMATIDDPAPLRQQLEEAQTALAEVEAERMALPAEGTGDNTVCECPSCATALVVEHVWKGPTVLKIHDQASAEQASSKEVRKQRAALDGRVAKVQGEITALNQRIARATQAEERAASARARLEEIGEPDEPDADAVAEAERAETEARSALAAFDAKAKADRLHGDITRNDQLAAILAPDGLRRRKLAAGLEAFNARLAALCAAAKWPAVRIDEDLRAHYGTRPVSAASGSGQWRARVVVQVAMAQMDGSAAVVIDEADILDFRGRNALLALLQWTGIKALVCLTINKPALVPDLAEVGLGASYWVDAGLVTAIEAEQEKGAA